MLYTLCYVSNQNVSFNKEDIRDLFKSSRNDNEQRQITGILLYNEGSFFQVLEGEKDIIMPLFQKIKKDPLHKDLIVIFDKPAEPLFKTYNTGFSVIQNNEDLESLKAYMNARSDTSAVSASIQSIIQSFLTI